MIDGRDAVEIAETGTVPGVVNITLGSLTYKLRIDPFNEPVLICIWPCISSSTALISRGLFFSVSDKSECSEGELATICQILLKIEKSMSQKGTFSSTDHVL